MNKQCAKYFACAVVAAFMIASAGAQTGDDTKNDSLVRTFMVPVGETADGIRFPYWENGKLKRMFFNVDFLEHKDLEHIQLKSAKITTYDDNDNVDLVLLLPYSVFNLKTEFLTTDKRFVLRRSDFELMGDSLELNVATHQATIKGNVKMLIYHFEDTSKKPGPHE